VVRARDPASEDAYFEATSGVDGNFLFENLHPEIYIVSASLSTASSTTTSTAAIVEPMRIDLAVGSREDVVLVAEPSGIVRVRVRTADGSATEELMVSVQRDGRGVGPRAVATESEVVLEGALAGASTVRVNDLGARTEQDGDFGTLRFAEARVEVIAGEEVGVEVELPGEDGGSEGKVTLTGSLTLDGRPTVGLAGVLQGPEPQTAIHIAQCRQDGTLHPLLLEPGRYRLQLSAGEGTFWLAIDLERDLDLRLDLKRVIAHGEVTDAESGRPLADAVVSLAGAEPSPLATSNVTRTSAAGAFFLEGLVRHRYVLNVTHPGYASRSVERSAAVSSSPELVTLARLPR
jgi:hypothetical protein